MPSQEMTQAEYARHRRVSRQMIGKLVANKKIPPSAISPAKKIDVAAADLALGETIERVIARERDDETDEQPQGGEAPAAGSGLNKAKTAVAFYQANLARLQYEEKIGKLVSRADVELSMQRAAEALGRDIDQLAARADDVVTAFTRAGPDGVRALLKQVSREIRGTIASNMRLIEQSEAEPDETESEDQAA